MESTSQNSSSGGHSESAELTVKPQIEEEDVRKVEEEEKMEDSKEEQAVDNVLYLRLSGLIKEENEDNKSLREAVRLILG
ncbi:MAG: hypothetical protein GY820_43880 [Gammaproteobacteria bacterium]|nr:hypothetical protein [Gammaproteobacteria bacterium]